MYNWAMFVWEMGRNDFVWAFIRWFFTLYLFWNIHQEIIQWRAKRFIRIQKMR